jgi:hypothetical protein
MNLEHVKPTELDSLAVELCIRLAKEYDARQIGSIVANMIIILCNFMPTVEEMDRIRESALMGIRAAEHLERTKK